MRAPHKTARILLGAIALLALAAIAAAAAALSAGMVRVRVVEKKPDGARFHLLLPAAAVPIGLRLLPERDRREMAAGVGPWLPVIEAATRELGRHEEFTLLEAYDRGERVSIRVVRGSLSLDVDSPEESVHISLPLRLVARLAADLEPLAPEGVARLQNP